MTTFFGLVFYTRSLHQLGLNCSFFYDARSVKSIIAKIHNEFGLVLIIEHWKESMICMKLLLRMKTEDVALEVTNRAKEGHSLKAGFYHKLKHAPILYG